MQHKKEYLPGYTGFVPKKNDMFGLTVGETRRQLVGESPLNALFAAEQTGFGHVETDKDKREFYSTVKDAERRKLGNRSKEADTWIGGPTQMLYPQHVPGTPHPPPPLTHPGYTGHIPGIVAENLFAKSYGKTSTKALKGTHVKGADVPAQKRYKSMATKEFGEKNFRRLGRPHPAKQAVDNPDVKTRRDNETYVKTLLTSQSIEPARSRLANIPTVGYQGTKSLYRQQISEINAGPHGYFNVNPIRHKLREGTGEDVIAGAEVEDGFKARLLAGAGQADVKIPVVGYTGHRKGVKAQGFFGKDFRDCTVQSQRIGELMS